ncbi:putative selenate reductase subunit YgfK [Limisalsivibrio acetivorans]|uniref:putative selenate reductase subunit YgfK n=1 Tax=Limisalsivibrio acetivorans TaxID=1304888 RepID=UPI0003B5AD56|nr:putative selenate reductase subunit YgfK [Limisalsivibrio acetivorans]
MTSDRFSRSSLKTLFGWIKDFDKTGEILGIRRELFFTPDKNDPFRMKRYGKTLETPLGVAAGPHSQLAQNIMAAWLTGSRYFELKTVQVLDELEITKPCIEMGDEGYNCEWSQELRLHESFDEYLNAWVMLHIMKDMFGFEGDESGFIFNMSVGYNLEGILSDSVQRFLDKMQNCPDELAAKIEEAAEFYPNVRKLSIPAQITDNVTVSTMHGCPPEETEKIGRYFIEERKLNTTIKLNPTLLGSEKLRGILNDSLGFETEVPDLAFEHDLEYGAGVKLIRSLMESAEKTGVEFNLKLTNTLENLNVLGKLPDEAEMIYMSGRALHPISINLASKLQEEFGGELDISFSAGVDCFNIVDTLACNLRPVTICSDILKPGGYGRMAQYVAYMRKGFEEADASSIEELTMKKADAGVLSDSVINNLKTYSKEVLTNPLYKKESRPYEDIKTERSLGFFDCAAAPCITKCAAGQNIPKYIEHIAEGELDKAQRTILATNPFPNVQGKVCDHVCQSKCTRINYDTPLLIRELKRYVADSVASEPLKPAPSNGLSVAVIGGGPAGLSCAYFLALMGFEIDLYEAKESLGGMASDGIPVFRLDDESLNKDIDNIKALGVRIHPNTYITSSKFEELRNKMDYVFIGVGAQKSLPLDIEGIGAEGVYDQLAFLSKVRKLRENELDIGRKVIIIGAGNSAMDAARTAIRMVGNNGEVTIVYRRTRKEMPCDPEEIRGALEEGVKLVELASPERVIVKNGHVTGLEVSRMELGEKDSSGRRRPVKIEGSEYIIEADNIVPAIGQQVELDFYPEDVLEVDQRTFATSIENVYAGGDAHRGASSLINAIGDGQKAAAAIIAKAGRDGHDLSPMDERKPDLIETQIKQAIRDFGEGTPELPADERKNFNLFVSTLTKDEAEREAERCLQCDLICNICTTVCPNRSNMYYPLEETLLPVQVLHGDGTIESAGTKRIEQPYQIINIGDYCNECGNCTTFCPTSGRPYMDKPKFHINEESFEQADFGFHFDSPSSMLIKYSDFTSKLSHDGNRFQYESPLFRAEFDADTMECKKAEILEKDIESIDLSAITDYITLYKGLRSRTPFTGV